MTIKVVNGRYALSPTPRVGGMADVYQAADMVDGQRTVALKFFRHGYLQEEVLAESFKRETQSLKALKHPNIVELIDAGIDADTHRYFIVLEWIGKNLRESLKENPLTGWDDFYKNVGKPILQALAFVHGRYLTHRDLKTTNILIDDQGRPKLADFGIAKLQGFIAHGVTLAGFASQPFASPEQDLGLRNYTRDVYGFGVVVLDCLTDVALNTREDVEGALEELSAPHEVLKIIDRAIALDPDLRPVNAGVLLAELDRVQLELTQSSIQKRTCYLQLTGNAVNFLRSELGIDSETEIKDQILKDLNSVCGIIPYRMTDEDGKLSSRAEKDEYLMFGDSCRYRVAVERYRRDRLVILKAWTAAPSVLEKNRDRAWSPSYNFSFASPRNLVESSELIRELQLKVDEHEADMRAALLEQEEQRLFNTWYQILQAKSDIERNKVAPLTYVSVSFRGARGEFHLTETPNDDLINQYLRINLPDRTYLKLEVDEIGPNNVVAYIVNGEVENVPMSGKMEFDTFAADQNIKRQKDALDAVRFDRAVHPKLRRLLTHPEESRLPKPQESIDFAQEMDEAKQQAVCVALGTEDFLLVEGPPGTGKTTFIAEVVIQTLRRDPESNVLITSQTHVALDNAIERIQSLNPELEIVRIAGRSSAARVSDKAKNLLLENRMEVWRDQVLKKGERFLSDWALQHNIDPHNVKVATLLRRLGTVLGRIENRQNDLSGLDESLESFLLEKEKTDLTDEQGPETEEIVALKEQITQLRGELRADQKEKKALESALLKIEDIADELVRLSPSELEAEVKAYLPDTPNNRRFYGLQDVRFQWEERFGKGTEFQIALLQSSQVVSGTCIGIMGPKGIENVDYDLCIVDEASKATPTETLVPLARSRRYILVGDQRQLSPFQSPELQHREILEKYDLSPTDLKRTLFDHLIERLPAQCKTALTVQHRMVPPIGDLIGDCFYADIGLKSAEKPLDTGLKLILPRPVMWFTTARLANHWDDKIGGTFVNHSEIREICRLLRLINRAANKLSTRRYSVAVITGYAGQKQALQRNLSAIQNQLTELDIDLNTVDAFQGREADIAIYSVTRANPFRKLGFLSEQERINVALSRGRYYLLIVGDHHFCRTVPGSNPIKRVVEYVEAHPAGCELREVQE